MFNEPAAIGKKYVNPFLARDAIQSIDYFIATRDQALTIASLLTIKAPLTSFGFSTISIGNAFSEGRKQDAIVGTSTLVSGLAFSQLMGTKGALIAGGAQLAYDFGMFDSQNSRSVSSPSFDGFTSADNTRVRVALPEPTSFFWHEARQTRRY